MESRKLASMPLSLLVALSTADWPSSGTATVKTPPVEEQGRAEAEEAAMALPAAVAATWRRVRIDAGGAVTLSMRF